jgi:hypothetical protein
MIDGNLEYLAISLPNLSFQNNEEVKVRVSSLLQKYAGVGVHEKSLTEILDCEAQKFLPEATFSVFQKINLRNIHELEFQQSKSRVLSNFARFTFDLKNKMRQLRLLDKENEEKSSSSLEKLLGQGTPLEKEIQIMKYQWEKLEELSIGHFADLEALINYKIKLMILTRWWSFHEERGFENYIRMTKNN